MSLIQYFEHFGWESLVEHTDTLAYMINHASCYQRNLIIMLLDLKNIFGKLDHQLNVENSILQGDSLTPLIF